jgi:hypothetical protein
MVLFCCGTPVLVGYNMGKGLVPHIFVCANCLSVMVRDWIRLRAGYMGLATVGGADMVHILPPTTRTGYSAPVVRRLSTVGLVVPMTWASYETRTMVPRQSRQSAGFTLLQVDHEMMDLASYQTKQLFDSMRRGAVLDDSFNVAEFTREWGASMPLDERDLCHAWTSEDPGRFFRLYPQTLPPREKYFIPGYAPRYDVGLTNMPDLWP